MIKIELQEETMEYAQEEAVKTLRTNLQFCGNDKKSILITSGIPEEGKTSIALRLAKSLAEIQKKVLLLDADLRKSSLQKKMRIGDIPFGLSHFLSGQCGLSEAVVTTNIAGFHLLFAGAGVPNATELLSHRHMEALMEQLKTVYDYIIIDSAPLGLVIDAAILAKYCDGAIIVVEEGKIRRKMVQDVKKRLEHSGCAVLGTVLNKVSLKKQHGYYKNEYKKYNYAP